MLYELVVRAIKIQNYHINHAMVSLFTQEIAVICGSDLFLSFDPIVLILSRKKS